MQKIYSLDDFINKTFELSQRAYKNKDMPGLFLNETDWNNLTLMLLELKDRRDKDMEKIKIKRLNDKAKIPHRGSDGAAGYDLYACINEPYAIPPHTTKKVETGLSIEIPHGYFGAIFARSGLATKEGLRPANCTGVCDEDYRGEYVVALHNDTDVEKIIEPNDRIAQLVILPYLPVEFEEVDELSDTDRGSDGFGSTGKA